MCIVTDTVPTKNVLMYLHLGNCSGMLNAHIYNTNYLQYSL